MLNRTCKILVMNLVYPYKTFSSHIYLIKQFISIMIAKNIPLKLSKYELFSQPQFIHFRGPLYCVSQKFWHICLTTLVMNLCKDLREYPVEFVDIYCYLSIHIWGSGSVIFFKVFGFVLAEQIYIRIQSGMKKYMDPQHNSGRLLYNLLVSRAWTCWWRWWTTTGSEATSP